MVNDGVGDPIIYHLRSPSYDFAFAVCSRMHPANAIRTLALAQPTGTERTGAGNVRCQAPTMMYVQGYVHGDIILLPEKWTGALLGWKGTELKKRRSDR